MTKFTFNGEPFEEKAEGKTIATHTVFSFKDKSDSGIWLLSTIENAMVKLVGTFVEEIHSSEQVIVKVYAKPTVEFEYPKIVGIAVEDFSCTPNMVTLVFPYCSISQDKLVSALETCKI